MLADECGHPCKDDDLLCNKYASARRIKVLGVDITLRSGRGRVVDHCVRDPRMLPGRRIRLHERDRTTQHFGLWHDARGHDAIGEALPGRRDAAVVVFVACKLGGVRRGVRASAIVLTARVSMHKSVITSSNKHHCANCLPLTGTLA